MRATLHARICLLLVALVTFGCCALDPSAQVTVGDVRVQALSPSLFRIEPKGPMGFEDRTTFLVVDRESWDGVPITVVHSDPSTSSAVLKTDHYTITFGPPPPPPPPAPIDYCKVVPDVDVDDIERIANNSALGTVTVAECCGNCTKIPDCIAWVMATGDPSKPGNCWLMAKVGGTHNTNGRIAGGRLPPPGPVPSLANITLKVTNSNGDLLYNTSDIGRVSQNLLWPSPGPSMPQTYAIKDYPRFYLPEWGPTPMPKNASVDPALVQTNGFDFRNNVSGDVYVFLLSDTQESWESSRREFIQLAGPTPVLPDWAFGTWQGSWWHNYTEEQAKQEVEQWRSDDLPIDIWGMDMNWRNSPKGHDDHYEEGMDHYYTYPRTDLFPDFNPPATAWFDFLESHGMRTFFNDHPFPANNGTAMQTSLAEVQFRWNGLTMWMNRGLTFWWFDRNWHFSIPPPMETDQSSFGPAWCGMDNQPWGSYLYYTTVEMFNKYNPDRQHTMSIDAPIALSKTDAYDNEFGGHPAQHRYPVWWTGDCVSLPSSIQSMVDAGVRSFMPYTHSDCGSNDARENILWTQHCALGSIFRYHGEYQPWRWGTELENTIRSYLKMRYKLMPTIISAGKTISDTAFPMVARGDLFWPQEHDASTNMQYIFLNDTLVAPCISVSAQNTTSRTVWIPPGQWTNAWNGSTVEGPKNVTASQPFEQVPMWHRRGGFVVTTPSPNVTVDAQDWSTLVVEAFPLLHQPYISERVIFERGTNHAIKTGVKVFTQIPEHDIAHVNVEIAPTPNNSRHWVVRFHLEPAWMLENTTINRKQLAASSQLVNVITPQQTKSQKLSMPFDGPRAAPPVSAGPTVEVHLESCEHKSHLLIRVRRLQQQL
eukprot:m.10222 g.10222  ORF g.10222 m.10222 type:complete len:875 (-) comp4226_c0_seq1:67-2691(-)